MEEKEKEKDAARNNGHAGGHLEDIRKKYGDRMVPRTQISGTPSDEGQIAYRRD